MIRFDVVGHVATIALDRPERKNAFTLEMLAACVTHLQRCATDDDVRVVVLTGSGDSFCAGVDLGVLADLDPAPLARKNVLTEQVHAVARAILALDKPLIAALNGVAVGAGMDISLMCDLRFAARSARLSEGYIKVGLVPGDGGCWLLPRLVGPSVALELLLSGRFVDADEALALRIVNRVYPDDELADRTAEFAAELAALSPVALQMIKRTVYQSASMDLAASLDLISSHMAIVQSTQDYAEAQAAFRERRVGQFDGR